jgi:ATP-binding cassette, subfamily C (CFTR/MRP), member 4
MPYYSGKLEVEGSIAYVEQEAVIFSDTIRNNITFGLEFHQIKYDMAVKLACLESDFKLLKQGDETVVGEKGITLSGGQKARLTLARAVYSGANIYLFDDPISAVDSRVAK